MTTDATRVAERMRAERDARDNLQSQRSPDAVVENHALFEGDIPNNWKADASIWLGQNLPLVRLHALPASLVEAWAAAMAHPDLKSLQWLGKAIERALSKARGAPLADATQHLQAWHTRVLWYRAFANEAQAAQTLTGEAYDYWCSMSDADGWAAQFEALVTIFRLLRAAIPTGDWLVSDVVARREMRTASLLVQADEILAAEGRQRLRDSLLRVPHEVAVLDEDEAADVRNDTSGIVKRAIAETAAAPARVVVRSADHLASPSKGELERRTSPRAEIAPITGRALPLVVPPHDLVAIREDLRREYPHAVAAIDAALVPVAGQAWTRLPNILLHGPAGTGKSELAQAIGRRLGLGVDVYSCAGAHDASYIGTSRQWSSGRFSVSLQAILRWQRANGIIVLDEIDKAGTGSHNGRLAEALLPFLEPTTSGSIRDPYLEAEVDLSGLSYIATANDVTVLPRPLLDRFTLVEVPEPDAVHVGDLAAGIVERVRRQRQTDERWLPDLDGEEMSVLAEHWQGGSIRRLRRLVERVLDLRSAMAPRH